MKPPAAVWVPLRIRQYGTGTVESKASASSPGSGGRSKPPHLPFPTAIYPTPYDIFHLPRSANTAQVKARYYDLVKLYHPDKAAACSSQILLPQARRATGKRRASDNEAEKRFKLIVDAYELLRHPTRRQMYLRTGDGWQHVSFSERRGPRTTRDPWGDARRATTPRQPRPFYQSGVWDWSTSRRGDAGSAGDGSDAAGANGFYTKNSSYRHATWKEHWDRRGPAGLKNGVVISGVAGVSALLYATQFWNAYSAAQLIEQWSEEPKPKEPEGDARLDADAWARYRSTPAGVPLRSTSSGKSYFEPSSAVPVFISSFVKAAEERHRATSADLQGARQEARVPWHFQKQNPQDNDLE